MKTTDFYRVHILQDSNKRFFGEIWEEGILLYRGAKQMNQANAARMLNRKIEELNLGGYKKIPRYVDETPKPEPAGTSKPTTHQAPKPISTPEPKTMKKTETPPAVQTTAPGNVAKPAKPKRKPFTPYGLNGYLVDKNGNVRLHLDRKATAQTIVLSPEMFRALSEMVERTLQQDCKNVPT